MDPPPMSQNDEATMSALKQVNVKIISKYTVLNENPEIYFTYQYQRIKIKELNQKLTREMDRIQF